MMTFNETSNWNAAEWSSSNDYKLLIEITARIHKAATVRECADLAIEGGRRIADVNDAIFYLFESDESFRAIDSGLALPIQLQKSPCDYLRGQLEPIVLAEAELAQPAVAGQTALLVPILGREERLHGSLLLLSSKSFSQREVSTLKSLALAVAVALENLNFEAVGVEGGSTDSKAELHALRLLLTEAEEARAAQNAYLAAISHEIRNPLGVMLGLTEIAIDQCEDRPETHDLLAAVRRNGEHLNRILGQVLDVSRIEAGCVDVEPTQFNLDSFLDELETDFRASLRRKQELCFMLAKSGDLPRFVCTDPTKLRQILTNLLSNALKFTEVGTIILKVGYQLTDAEGGRALIFRVCDSGIGIAKQNIGRLFSSFGQAEPSTAKRFGGTGLGLMIGRQLARSLGGDLTITRSEVGVGSEFLLTLPIV